MESKDIVIFFIILLLFLAVMGFFILSVDFTIYDGPLSSFGALFNLGDLSLGQLFGLDPAPTAGDGGALQSSGILKVINIIKIISGVISTILIALILVIAMRSWQFNDRYSTKRPEFAGSGTVSKREKVARRDWNRLVKKASTTTQEGAPLLVIEADAILDTALKSFGIVGDDMGGRMKAISPTLQTSELMWQSHKLRNEIAHSPGMVITKKHAISVLSDYEKVLGELDVI